MPRYGKRVVNDECLPKVVSLPVCERCGNVGKQPGGSSTTYSCTGPATSPHPRQKMRLYDFHNTGLNEEET